MISLDDSVIARYKKGGKQFEVFVDPDGSLDLKRGEDINIEDIIAVESIFEDANKGNLASESDIQEIFGTDDVYEIIYDIIKHGDIQLTKEQRKRMLDEKRKQVVNIIAQNAINPQTKTPHPPSRIESAMEEAKVNIDLLKSVDEQVNTALKAIRPIIPIRFEEVKVAVKIPASYAAKSYGEISRFGTLEKEEWQNDGSWVAVVSIPAGLQNDFYSLINRLTKGEAESKLL
jgi:ribosome maturation protein SDO1